MYLRYVSQLFSQEQGQTWNDIILTVKCQNYYLNSEGLTT